MTEAQQTGGRARWFRRDTASGATAATAAEAKDSSGRHGLPDGSHAGGTSSPEPVGATEPSAGPTTGPATEFVRDPDIGRRRRVADQAVLRERFGGRKVGAAFFGWLVAVGMTVMLSTIAAAIGLAVGTSMDLHPGGADAAPVGLTGGAVALVVLAVAYFTGGYVAGRLARFDGARNGLLAWVVGLLITIVAAVVGAVAGAARSDLFGDLRLPVLTGDPTMLTVAGVIVLVVVLVVTAFAAALGGRMGERFHRRVDKAAERL